MSKHFHKAYRYVLVIVVVVLTTFMLAKIRTGHFLPRSVDTEVTPTDAAFRDGLYQGKLDSTAGRPEHLSVGRWTRAKDRNAFAAGYQRSYRNESTAARETLANQTPPSQD